MFGIIFDKFIPQIHFLKSSKYLKTYFLSENEIILKKETEKHFLWQCYRICGKIKI